MQGNNVSPSPELLSDIKVHGFLPWTSFCFLMPVGVLAIRMSCCQKFERMLDLILQTHAALQTVSAVLATAAAAMSIKNSFTNRHRRIGIVMYGIIWLQALIGFLQPQRGCKERRLWFSLNWTLGIALALLGVINICTGLFASLWLPLSICSKTSGHT